MLHKEKVKAVIDSVKETIDVKEIPVRRKAVRILLNEIDRLTLENNQLKRITSGVDLAKSVNHWKERAKKAEAFIDLLIVEFQDSMDEKLLYEMLNGYILKKVETARHSRKEKEDESDTNR